MQQHVFFILITSHGNIWQGKYQNYEIRCFFKMAQSTILVKLLKRNDIT